MGGTRLNALLPRAIVPCFNGSFCLTSIILLTNVILYKLNKFGRPHNNYIRTFFRKVHIERKIVFTPDIIIIENFSNRARNQLCFIDG